MIRTVRLVMLILVARSVVAALGQQTATDRAIANHQAMASPLKQFAHDQIRIEGPLVTRWLPLTSAAVIMILGLAIAARSLMTGGILQIRV